MSSDSQDGALDVADDFDMNDSDDGQLLESGDEPGMVQNEEKEDDLDGAQKVENQQHDEEIVLDSDDNEDIPSNEDDDAGDFGSAGNDDFEPKVGDVSKKNDMPPVSGAYNPADYENLNVDDEVKELFEYIGRYQPQVIPLDSKFKPYIPDFIPAVGEVDAFLKMPKPDDENETLGITTLDEPSINSSDPQIIEMKYVQLCKTTTKSKAEVRNIVNADKNPSEVQNWINNISELHKNRPPPSVAYTK